MREAISILLIDDDEDDYLITQEIVNDITNRQYALEWTNDYRTAIELIAEQAHHVYLVDYRLGGFDGLELISEAMAKGSKAPFILLTGQGDVETDEKAMRVGVTDYLVKGSFSPSELDRSIRYSIEHKKNMIQIQQLNAELEQRVRSRTLELAETVSKLEQANQDLKDQVRVRKIAEEALRESQYLYSTIAHNFPNGAIAVLDDELNYVLVDGTELRFHNLETRDMIGKPIHAILGDELGELLKEIFQDVFKGDTKSVEINFRGRDYLVLATPLPGKSEEEFEQILMVTENITERKQAEREIRKALAKERELNELKSRFVTMASHEFRTPLSTILSSASLIARYEEAQHQDKRLRHVDRIKSNVNHLNRLLNDFLSLGKLEEGKTVNQPNPIDLVKVCKTIIEEMELMAKADQHIQLKVNGEKRPVMLDEQLIKNVLINILSNALKYSPSGKDVFFELSYQPHEIVLDITDQGIGIPEAEQVHLFERFFRAKNTTNIQGTGLGLNIVKRYVDLMGGQITLSSKLNVGTKVQIKMPG